MRDSEVPVFAGCYRLLTDGFDSDLPGLGNCLFWQIGRQLWPLRRDWKPTGQSSLPATRRRNQPNNQCQAVFEDRDWDFPWFSSVVRRMSQRRNKACFYSSRGDLKPTWFRPTTRIFSLNEGKPLLWNRRYPSIQSSLPSSQRRNLLSFAAEVLNMYIWRPQPVWENV